MALQEGRLACWRVMRTQAQRQVRFASSATVSSSGDLEKTSLDAPLPGDDVVKSFDPLAQSKRRRHQLPSSRYKFRPPKYYRGPLHPHQPPPPEDIASREFVPGPFTVPRLRDTYESIVASDYLTLTYAHEEPGKAKPKVVDRMRPWEGESPYLENRAYKGPRGTSVLRPIHRAIKWTSVPELKKIVVHSHIPRAADDSAKLHVASIALQSITNVRCEVHKSKKSVADWEARAGKLVSLTTELEGENMYHFLSKLVEIVLPRIKDFKGISAAAGDSTGNITFGLEPEDVALFPEIEVNYDMYPPPMIPGCNIHVQTTATTDKEARLLLATLGIPFIGKMKRG